MAIRAPLLICGLALGGLVACGAIVNLDSADTPIDTRDSGTTTQPITDAGPSGSVTSDGALTTDGGVTVTPTSIDIKAVCGTQQLVRIEIKNDGATLKTYSVAIPASESFTLEGANAEGIVTGDVAPGSIAGVTLRATSTKPGKGTADLTVVVDGESTTLNAALNTVGAGLVFSPSPVEFGQVRQNAPSAETTVTMRNDGNDPITIKSFGNAGDFNTPTEVKLDPGMSVTRPFTMKAGAAGELFSNEAVPQTEGAHCGPTPTLLLKGQRINTNVTVTPGNVELGSPACNTSPGNKIPITLTNYSTLDDATFTVSPPSDSRFTYSVTNGTIVRAVSTSQPTTATIEVGIKSVGSKPEDVNETVTISTGGPEPKSWPINLHFKVTGAVIVIDRTSVDLRNNQQADVPIRNTGNVPVCVEYSSDNGQIRVENDRVDRLNAGDTGQRLSTAFFNSNYDSDNSGRVTIRPYTCPGTTAPAICNGVPSLDVNGKL